MDALRNGSGPWFLEFSTYRWREHCGPFYDNDLGYRTVEEFESWKLRDPIAIYQADLLKRGLITETDLQAMDDTIAAEVRAAFDAADAAPFPDPSETFADVYAGA